MERLTLDQVIALKPGAFVAYRLDYCEAERAAIVVKNDAGQIWVQRFDHGQPLCIDHTYWQSEGRFYLLREDEMRSSLNVARTALRNWAKARQQWRKRRVSYGTHWLTVNEMRSLKPGDAVEYTDTHGNVEDCAIVVDVVHETDGVWLQRLDQYTASYVCLHEIHDDGYCYYINRRQHERIWRRHKRGVQLMARLIRKELKS